MIERIGMVSVLAALAACAAVDEGSGRSRVPEESNALSPGEASARFEAAEARVQAREYAAARELYLSVARAAENPAYRGDVALVAESCAQVARMDSVLGEPERGAVWLERAERLTTPDRPRAFARLLVVQGVYAREEGRRDDAVALFERCYDFSMRHELHDRAYDAAHHVAIAAEPAAREAWAKKGLAAAEAAGEAGWLAVLWNNLGWDYLEQGRDAEALDALRRAQTYHHRENGHPTAALISDYSVAFALRRNGELAQARSMQEAVNEAALRAFERGDDAMLEWVAQSRRELGELDATEGRIARGADRIEQAIEELRRAGFGGSEWGAGLLDQYEARLADLRAAE